MLRDDLMRLGILREDEFSLLQSNAPTLKRFREAIFEINSRIDKKMEELKNITKSAEERGDRLINELYKHVDYRYSILQKKIEEQQLTLHLILEQMGYRVTRIDQRTELKLIEVTKKNSGRSKK